MTLCTIDSLIEKGIDYDDQMLCFEVWLWNANCTARDEAFDVAEVYGEFESLQYIKEWPEEKIKSDGYVLHTLQEALWCLINISYRAWQTRAIKILLNEMSEQKKGFLFTDVFVCIDLY